MEAVGALDQEVKVIKTARKPGIRVPKKREPNKTEEDYSWELFSEFGNCLGGTWSVKYEAITFKLSGGNYTPDWTVWRNAELVLVVECKGPYRLGSASASHRAFKEAASAWPLIAFRYAKQNKDKTWEVTELNK